MEKQNNKLPTWDTLKTQDFIGVKRFYQKVMLFPQDVLDQIIFYGGTTTYIASQEENIDREFGDIDWVVPAEKLSFVREYLEKIDDFIIQYDGKKVAEKYHIKSSDGIHDFGFKGCLFGMKLSVHPISETKDKNVISKWIKVKDEKIDLIANVLMLKNSNLNEIVMKIKFGNKYIKIIRHELNIAWKKRRMEFHDEQDIKFMLAHKAVLGIIEQDIDLFISKMPTCDVTKAYKITSNGIIELDSGLYEDY